MSKIDEALELTQIDPLPVDVRERLLKLEREAPLDERWQFVQIWSGLIVKEGQEGSAEEI